ncbi:MAG: PilW family protein [Thiotrichaceae bacterium]|nr:PilW family protein [Thiotrichaceae bacterium]
MKINTHQKGFTLLETMIALTIGIFLSFGMIQVYTGNKASFRLQKASSEIQRNAQFSLDIITAQINTAGSAGFYGELSTGVDNILKNGNNPIWSISLPIYGYNNVTASTVLAGVSGFIANSDILLIKKMGSSLPIKNHVNNTTIKLEKTSQFSIGDILLLADVDQASLFQADVITETATETTIKIDQSTTILPNNSSNFTNAFAADAELSKLNTHMYYLKNGKNSRPALYEAKLVNSGTALTLQESELASNIADFHVVYGVDENADKMVDEYKDASGVASWDKVLSVGIALLVTSRDTVNILDSVAYEFDSTDFTYNKSTSGSVVPDKRLKRTFRTFASIRNRTL